MLSEPRGGPSRDVTRQMIPEDRKEKAVGVRQQSDQNTGDSWMGGWRGERTERERGETNKRQTTGKRARQSESEVWNPSKINNENERESEGKNTRNTALQRKLGKQRCERDMNQSELERPPPC